MYAETDEPDGEELEVSELSDNEPVVSDPEPLEEPSEPDNEP